MSVSANSPGRASGSSQHSSSETGAQPFCLGSIVLLTLNTPREKFWGALLELSQAGVSVRGISLASLDDCIQQLRAKEGVDAAAVFFPMHRVERMELDTRCGELPSIGERFLAQTGIEPTTFFAAGVQR